MSCLAERVLGPMAHRTGSVWEATEIKINLKPNLKRIGKNNKLISNKHELCLQGLSKLAVQLKDK